MQVVPCVRIAYMALRLVPVMPWMCVSGIVPHTMYVSKVRGTVFNTMSDAIATEYYLHGNAFATTCTQAVHVVSALLPCPTQLLLHGSAFATMYARCTHGINIDTTSDLSRLHGSGRDTTLTTCVHGISTGTMSKLLQKTLCPHSGAVL